MIKKLIREYIRILYFKLGELNASVVTWWTRLRIKECKVQHSTKPKVNTSLIE